MDHDELHRCAESGNLERIRELVEDGVSIDQISRHGHTALFAASIWGHFDIVVYMARTLLTPAATVILTV
jgi:ankyrin repeat protein